MTKRSESRIAEVARQADRALARLIEDVSSELAALAPEMLAAGVSIEDARREYIGMDNVLAGPADWAFTRAYLDARKAAEQPSPSVPE